MPSTRRAAAVASTSAPGPLMCRPRPTATTWSDRPFSTASWRAKRRLRFWEKVRIQVAAAAGGAFRAPGVGPLLACGGRGRRAGGAIRPSRATGATFPLQGRQLTVGISEECRVDEFAAKAVPNGLPGRSDELEESGARGPGPAEPPGKRPGPGDGARHPACRGGGSTRWPGHRHRCGGCSLPTPCFRPGGRHAPSPRRRGLWNNPRTSHRGESAATALFPSLYRRSPSGGVMGSRDGFTAGFVADGAGKP